MAIKQGAGVLQVLFGGGDAVKRFVENVDDALLLGGRRERKFEFKHFLHIGARHTRTRTCGIYSLNCFISFQFQAVLFATLPSSQPLSYRLNNLRALLVSA